MNKNTTIQILCDYCQTSCTNDLVSIGSRNFCCYGCATLSDVLSHIKNAPLDVSLKYKQLDLEETFDQVVDFQNDTIYNIGISLPAIHCSSCIELLEDLPSFYDGIRSCKVNFEHKRCTITVDKTLPLSFLSQLLDDLGYPPQISISEKQKKVEKEVNSANLIKMAVAGFCFGNIMLFTMPHYFGLNVSEDSFFSHLFSVLSVTLSIPVVFYSGKEYLTSAYRALAAGKSHLNIPISIGIFSLFGWSLYEVLSGVGIGYLDSLSGLIFFLLVGKWFQHKVYDQVSYHRSVQEFIPLVVRKKEGNSHTWQRVYNLQKGDVVIVKSNETIPVNGVLEKGIGLIDYSFITGEELPASVHSGHAVYAGGCQKSGEIHIRIDERPAIDKLWSTWSSHSTKEFQNYWTNNISKYFTIAVLSIAVIAATIWSFIDPHQAWFIFISVLIVACPCALALSAPFTYGNILRVFSKNHFFVKEANAISALSEINHIVLDKTGTITKKDSSNAVYIGTVLPQEASDMFYTLAYQSNHPLSISIVESITNAHILDMSYFQEDLGKGLQGIITGKHVKLGSSQWVTGQKSNVTSVYASIDGQVYGYFQIQTQYRPGLRKVLDGLASFTKISILSGDNDSELSNLKKLFPSFKYLKFNLNPAQKALEIIELQKDEKVLMIGDGINDSNAIARGDFGVAITENLSGFYPGSDAVLLADSFSKLPEFVALARYSKAVLKWSLVFSLMYNLTGVILAVSGLLTPIIAAILMPISSVSVVLLDTLLVRKKAKNLQLI